jgi:pimeloyl-ACP methyl ester carboxylesterase
MSSPGAAGPDSEPPPAGGYLPPGVPFFRVGAGRPLVVLPGLGAPHELPRRFERAAEEGPLRAFASSREVWWIGRRPGLPRTTTMAGLAADTAEALGRFGGPVDILGVSTGGSVALQLAADHPHLVHRLVLVAAGCRLGPRGKQGQRAVLARLDAGDRRGAGAEMVRLVGMRPVARQLEGWIGWLAGPWMLHRATGDLAAMILAEDGFDLTGRLGGITTPTLVVGGDEDAPYGPEVFRETAEGLPHGHLRLYAGRGHVGVQRTPGFAQDVLAFLDAEGSETRGAL